MPQNYGAMPLHYLLRNNGQGKFEVVTEQVFPQAKMLGFVSAASWVKNEKINASELVVVGEYMAPRIFRFNNTNFEEIKTNLDGYHGWWQSLAVADVDGDGDQDLIIGNMGSNCYLKPDSANPIKLWFGDFDKNQLYDKVLTRTIDGKDVPVFLKRDLTDQIPSLKKQNLRFEAYATKSIQELFPAPQMQYAQAHIFNYAQSVIAINNGNGNYTIKPLPTEVQLSSVHAICVTDLDGDKKPDLLMGGNQYATMPQFGRLDASFGHVLMNKGSGNFNWIEPKKSGLQIRGAIKDIQPIKGAVNGYLFLRNNDTPIFISKAVKTAVTGSKTN